MIYQLNIISGNSLQSFTYRNSINDLPSGELSLLSLSNNLTYNFRFEITEYQPSISYGNYFKLVNLNPINAFDIINRRWEKIWKISLRYANFMKYIPKDKTITQCNISLLGVMNYILSFYPQFTSYLKGHNIPNIGKIYRYDFNDIGIVGYLQYLESFGYYWFIDMDNSNLIINRYNNPIYKENNHLIYDYSDISIDEILPEYKNIALIKEPYTDNLERRIVLDAQNPCVVLKNPARNVSIIYQTGDANLLYFSPEGDKIGGQLSNVSPCVLQNIDDCLGRYTYVFEGSSPCATPCNGQIVCSRIEKETQQGVACNQGIFLSEGYDCIGQLKLYVPCGSFLGNSRVEVELSNFCDVDNNCILQGLDYEFDKKQIKINLSSDLNLPDFAPASISYANIDETIWNLIIDYYKLKLKVKRKYYLRNILCNGKLEVGYFYDLLINNQVRRNLLLEELEISSTEKGFTVNGVLSEIL
ncbi:MAG: hypothetical protein ACP5O4_07680 [bacterium]